MGSIYMYARLGLGVYGPYTCIYTEIEACVQSRADIYIYMLEFWRARPNLARTAQYGTGSNGIRHLASIYANAMHIYGQ